MDLPIFQIDAFIREDSRLYSGNPAAVIPLREWLSDEQMQAIAAENNLSETTFFVTTEDNRYHLRWFTPSTEVDLCGHATLATAHVIHQILNDQRDVIPMTCQVGEISVAVRADEDDVRYELNFPARAPETVSGKRLLNKVEKILGQKVVSLHQSRDLIAVLENEDAVLKCTPDFAAMSALECFALAVTTDKNTLGKDFISRFFAPAQGIDEDPVTGSSFCSLAPLWAEKLGKSELSARQCSARGGDIDLTNCEEGVAIAGKTFHYMQGVIRLPD